MRARFSPDAWSLELGVWEGGVLVGTQGLSTSSYGVDGVRALIGLDPAPQAH